MIWLISAVLLFQILSLLIIWLTARSIIDEIKELPRSFPPLPAFPECKYEHPQHCNFEPMKCLYSPGSEPERICALREEDKKNKDSKTQVIPAPRWIDRSPPGEE